MPLGMQYLFKKKKRKRRIETCVEQHWCKTKEKSAINEHVSTFQLEGVRLGEFVDNGTQTVHGVWAELLSTPPLFPCKNKNSRHSNNIVICLGPVTTTHV